MRCYYSVEKKVLNVVELGDGELVYIRLNDGKKHLLRARPVPAGTVEQ